MGRPTKLDDATQQKIERALRAGVPVRWACEAAGIANRTYYDWLARGEEWLEEPVSKVPKAEQPYVEFLRRMRAARAEGLALPAAELYQLMTNRAVDPAVRLRALQFFLTHADRENWHPLSAAAAAQLEEDVVVELAWE